MNPIWGTTLFPIEVKECQMQTEFSSSWFSICYNPRLNQMYLIESWNEGNANTCKQVLDASKEETFFTCLVSFVFFRKSQLKLENHTIIVPSGRVLLLYCHDPGWTDQGGVMVSSEFPRAKLRWNDTKQSVKHFIHGRSKLNLEGVNNRWQGFSQQELAWNYLSKLCNSW